MDEEPLQLNQSPQSIDRSYRQPDQHEAQCLLCRRLFSPEAELNEAFEAIPICRGCKLSVLDDTDTGANMRNLIRRRRYGRRNRLGSSESIEDLFSHQFSQLISLVRQNHEALIDGDSASILHNHTSHTASRSRSRRWRAFSDNDSDSVDYVESLNGESDSILSFGGYGGLDQWNSDNEEDDDGEWEEADVDEAPRSESHTSMRDATGSQITGNSGGFRESTVVRWMLRENQLRYYSDFFFDVEGSEIPPYLENTGPYLDARGFEEVLEQLAENDDGSRRGAPPASACFVESLPTVIISKDHEKNGSLICPVCKDPLLICAEAKQLPCKHLYHSNCILPWLSTRNSCPVCRYELPTDDPDYEEGKQRMNTSDHEGHYHLQTEESSSEISTDMETDEAMQANANANANASDNQAESSNRAGGGRGRWLFLAAAPIVSMVGVAVVLWLRNSFGNSSICYNHRAGDPHQIQNSHSISSPANRSNRRWWSLF
ncbi:Zinc finger RING/FYVE/PHD-type protein [Dioscorea alata]|uniref:Zinc finger RING/FYVE/PHD-type protein n=1 Tax=Dioscorea alata TaxID=55571 RepID=A0ACB7VF30_DIOAL|nr:Zinc finger RING/FYVE/PHD-type protein [Dioscorea alata]